MTCKNCAHRNKLLLKGANHLARWLDMLAGHTSQGPIDEDRKLVDTMRMAATGPKPEGPKNVEIKAGVLCGCARCVAEAAEPPTRRSQRGAVHDGLTGPEDDIEDRDEVAEAPKPDSVRPCGPKCHPHTGRVRAPELGHTKVPTPAKKCEEKNKLGTSLNACPSYCAGCSRLCPCYPEAPE